MLIPNLDTYIEFRRYSFRRYSRNPFWTLFLQTLFAPLDFSPYSSGSRSYSCDHSPHSSGFRSYYCEMKTDVGGFFRVSIKLECREISFAQRNFSPFERKLRNKSPKISPRATNENHFSFTGHSFDNAFWPQNDK